MLASTLKSVGEFLAGDVKVLTVFAKGESINFVFSFPFSVNTWVETSMKHAPSMAMN